MTRDGVVMLGLVFFSGFANLATEIIGPRLFASLFGNTNIVWAVMISVTLVGLSVGYAFGGRVKAEAARRTLAILLIVNALWLIVVGWVVWEVPSSAVASGVRIDASVLIITAMAAFFVPSLLFGMISPIAITLLSLNRPREEWSEVVGNVYALGTIGSVSGALISAFYLIPWVGLSESLRVFAVILVFFAAYFFNANRRPVAGVALIACLLLPQPSYQWRDDDNLELLAQRDGYYQTIRVYEGEDFVQMHLGPTFHSRMNLETGEPTFNYAQRMVEMVGDPQGQDILVIGGAGHSMTRYLEERGATVREVEIDPLVVTLSDEHFGPVESEIIVQDGRIYVENVEPGSFDMILVDAFDGAATVPPQLTTLEFFRAVEEALKPGGRMLYNFVGTPEGPRSRSYKALSVTIAGTFERVGAVSSTENNVAGEDSQNIIFAASNDDLADLALSQVPDEGHILTDNHNPIDIFLQESRGWYYFRG